MAELDEEVATVEAALRVLRCAAGTSTVLDCSCIQCSLIRELIGKHCRQWSSVRPRRDPNIAAGAYGDADNLCELLLNQLREGADDASDAASTRDDADMGGSSDSGKHGEHVPDGRASRLEVSTMVATAVGVLLDDSRSGGRKEPSGDG